MQIYKDECLAQSSIFVDRILIREQFAIVNRVAEILSIAFFINNVLANVKHHYKQKRCNWMFVSLQIEQIFIGNRIYGNFMEIGRRQTTLLIMA